MRRIRRWEAEDPAVTGTGPFGLHLYGRIDGDDGPNTIRGERRSANEIYG